MEKKHNNNDINNIIKPMEEFVSSVVSNLSDEQLAETIYNDDGSDEIINQIFEDELEKRLSD